MANEEQRTFDQLFAAPSDVNARTVQADPNKPSLSAAEKKQAERERILSALTYCKYEDDWFDSDDTKDIEPACPVCGANDKHSNETNRQKAWLGIGPDEHCRECGAEPEHQHPTHRNRECWQLEFLLIELEMVEKVYRSYRFMSREQTGKNRKYFCDLLTTIQMSDHDHWKDRYIETLSKRHADELYENIIQIATRLNAGNRELALNEYREMSREIDDLYFIMDDLRGRLVNAGFAQVDNLSVAG